MFKLNTKANAPQWFTFTKDKQIEVRIRPASLYTFPRFPNDQGDFELTPKDFLDMCSALIVDWKGVNDEDNKPVKCSINNKILALEQIDDLSAWVMKNSTEISESIKVIEAKKEKDLKNLSKSPIGETPKSEK